MALFRSRSDRLIIRLPAPSDAAAIAAYYRKNQVHLERFEPRHPAELYLDDHWTRAITNYLDESISGSSCRTFVFESDDRTVIGSANLTGITRGVFQACYLGYSIDADLEGKGFMSEALRALISHAFNDLHLHRIMANYIPWNRRSHRLLEKLGFVVEGYAKKYLFINGEWEDHVLTSLTNGALVAPIKV